MPNIQPSAVISSVAAVFGVGLYFYEIPDRREGRETLAWQILAEQSSHPGNGGQKWALEVLAKDGVSLHGIRVVRADLTGNKPLPLTSDENDPTGLQLSRVSLRWAILLRSNLGHADLSYAHLENADFRCTSLGRANLQGAYLGGAHFDEADLSGTNFTDAHDIDRASFKNACVSTSVKPVGLPNNLVDKLLLCPTWDLNKGNGAFGQCTANDVDSH